jgi:hypothetical protein
MEMGKYPSIENSPLTFLEIGFKVINFEKTSCGIHYYIDDFTR